MHNMEITIGKGTVARASIQVDVHTQVTLGSEISSAFVHIPIQLLKHEESSMQSHQYTRKRCQVLSADIFNAALTTSIAVHTSVYSQTRPAWPRQSGVRSSTEFIAVPPHARVSLEEFSYSLAVVLYYVKSEVTIMDKGISACRILYLLGLQQFSFYVKAALHKQQASKIKPLQQVKHTDSSNSCDTPCAELTVPWFVQKKNFSRKNQSDQSTLFSDSP